jgi:hypothetical protein
MNEVVQARLRINRFRVVEGGRHSMVSTDIAHGHVIRVTDNEERGAWGRRSGVIDTSGQRGQRVISQHSRVSCPPSSSNLTSCCTYFTLHNTPTLHPIHLSFIPLLPTFDFHTTLIRHSHTSHKLNTLPSSHTSPPLIILSSIFTRKFISCVLTQVYITNSSSQHPQSHLSGLSVIHPTRIWIDQAIPLQTRRITSPSKHYLTTITTTHSSL